MPLELVRGGAKALEGELGPDSISTCALALTVGYIVIGWLRSGPMLLWP